MSAVMTKRSTARAELTAANTNGLLERCRAAAACGSVTRPAADFLDLDRRELIRLAGCEVIDWVSLIESAQEHATSDSGAIDRLMPQILRRINTLGSIVLSGVDDRSESNEDLSARLNGKRAA